MLDKKNFFVAFSPAFIINSLGKLFIPDAFLLFSPFNVLSNSLLYLLFLLSVLSQYIIIIIYVIIQFFSISFLSILYIGSCPLSNKLLTYNPFKPK